MPHRPQLAGVLCPELKEHEQVEIQAVATAIKLSVIFGYDLKGNANLAASRLQS